MILTIAKRTKRPKKEVSLADSKKFFSQNEELEKVVSHNSENKCRNCKKSAR